MSGLKLLSLSMLALGLAGCHRDDSAMADRLDRIDHTQQEILAQLKNGSGPGGAAAGAQGRGGSAARPVPTEVYSVPVAGAPAAGPPDAKVTIVEAFDFA